MSLCLIKFFEHCAFAVLVTHQSIPSANIPRKPPGTFSHGQIPTPPGAGRFCKIRPPRAKNLDKTPTPRRKLFTFLNTVIVILA